MHESISFGFAYVCTFECMVEGCTPLNICTKGVCIGKCLHSCIRLLVFVGTLVCKCISECGLHEQLLIIIGCTRLIMYFV